jgi:hypothetical protein
MIEFSLVPADPTDADMIRVRMDISGSACAFFTSTSSVDLPNHLVHLHYNFPDFCDPTDPANTITPRFLEIGTLPAGTYEIRYTGCGNPAPPLPQCEIFLTQQLVVASSTAAAPEPIPALSIPGLILLMAGLAVSLRWLGFHFAPQRQ